MRGPGRVAGGADRPGVGGGDDRNRGRARPAPLSTPGLVTRDQDFPFQCSISGSEVEPAFVEPTAHALLAEAAATPRSWPPVL